MHSISRSATGMFDETASEHNTRLRETSISPSVELKFEFELFVYNPMCVMSAAGLFGSLFLFLPFGSLLVLAQTIDINVPVASAVWFIGTQNNEIVFNPRFTSKFDVSIISNANSQRVVSVKSAVDITASTETTENTDIPWNVTEGSYRIAVESTAATKSVSINVLKPNVTFTKPAASETLNAGDILTVRWSVFGLDTARPSIKQTNDFNLILQSVSDSEGVQSVTLKGSVGFNSSADQSVTATIPSTQADGNYTIERKESQLSSFGSHAPKEPKDFVLVEPKEMVYRYFSAILVV